jgi:release factor glutamine methyltransferase
MIFAEALAEARKAISPSEARLLLQETLGITAASVVAHPERELAPGDAARFRALVSRRAAGEPIAYLVGRREFYGRQFAVSPAVLIPRPETELLVDVGQAKLAACARPRILDLGTGSGCLAVTLALATGGEVVAADLSAEALAVACANAESLNAEVRFVASDWYSAIDGDFDLIVANPPYVANGDPHLSEGDLRFEPAVALASGADGLTALRLIVADARRFLRPRGWLFLEHGYDQGPAVTELLAAGGLRDIEQHRDLTGIVRVSGGIQG